MVNFKKNLLPVTMTTSDRGISSRFDDREKTGLEGDLTIIKLGVDVGNSCKKQNQGNLVRGAGKKAGGHDHMATA